MYCELISFASFSIFPCCHLYPCYGSYMMKPTNRLFRRMRCADCTWFHELLNTRWPNMLWRSFPSLLSLMLERLCRSQVDPLSTDRYRCGSGRSLQLTCPAVTEQHSLCHLPCHSVSFLYCPHSVGAWTRTCSQYDLASDTFGAVYLWFGYPNLG